MTIPTADALRAMPKVELHVHLEGSFAPARIAQLAAAVGEPLPRPVDDLFAVTDLDAFLEFLSWTCGLVRDRETAEQVAHDFAARTATDTTRYAEVIVNPTHWPAWDLSDLVDALAAGFERAEADGLTDCRLLLSISREQSGDEAMALVRWMAEHRPPRVVGLSIDGNEARSGRTGDRFAPAFALARSEGFGCVAHAGESSGPDGVIDALDLLQVDRIDHGVRAAEDPGVLARVVDAGVPLDVCVTSNLTILYDGLDQHPLAQLLDAGAVVTLNTDDPGFLGVDLTGELELAAEHLDWSITEVATRMQTAIDASFCAPERGALLRAELAAFLAALATTDYFDLKNSGE